MVTKLPADEAGRVKAASIIRALGVADGPGFDALMDALTEDQAGGWLGGGVIRGLVHGLGGGEVM